MQPFHWLQLKWFQFHFSTGFSWTHFNSTLQLGWVPRWMTYGWKSPDSANFPRFPGSGIPKSVSGSASDWFTANSGIQTLLTYSFVVFQAVPMSANPRWNLIGQILSGAKTFDRIQPGSFRIRTGGSDGNPNRIRPNPIAFHRILSDSDNIGTGIRPSDRISWDDDRIQARFPADPVRILKAGSDRFRAVPPASTTPQTPDSRANLRVPS